MVIWRRDRDSNPGRLLHLAGFQDQCIQPLCHPSSVEHDDEVGLISQQLKSLSQSILSYLVTFLERISPHAFACI